MLTFWCVSDPNLRVPLKEAIDEILRIGRYSILRWKAHWLAEDLGARSEG